jgi:hypothetical protein
VNENVKWKPARNSPRFVQPWNATNTRQRALLTFLFSVMPRRKSKTLAIVKRLFRNTVRIDSKE